ncbi:MarR family transcriptional regulator [Sphingomonas sp. MG17]|uniref:MarR family transcriptional regulator n=1 Tax=Sphingomonas tagetis TaxID=2949092 RepID=A0A9X2HP06_9SPHN|nr:MarR family transcriptional regulator [Sphingomonas tagetis]MCP3733132.1 MarR family transcriptional regulator [Sphingomonas tagetis]
MTQFSFDLDHFLPYLLNQAAELTAKRFEQVYRTKNGLTRTKWRIISHLGSTGAMTAARLSHTEKTKISRAVGALQTEGLVLRVPSTTDRRTETLQLTSAGEALFASLSQEAAAFDRQLRALIGAEAATRLEEALKRLVESPIVK